MKLKQRFKRLHLEMTGFCNLRCKHCYNSQYYKEELSTSQIFKIIDLGKRLNFKNYAFSGGEPFTRKDLLKIIEYCPEPIILLTNAYLIDDEMLEKIAQSKKIIEFRISWEGFEGQLKLRNKKPDYIFKMVRKILDSNLLVTLNTTLGQHNINELNRMYNKVRLLKVDRWRIDMPFLLGRYKDNQRALQINQKKFSQPLKKLLEKYIKEKPNFELEIFNIFRSSTAFDNDIYQFKAADHPCSYQTGLTIRPDGQVSFCPTLNKVYGNILTTDLVEIISQKEWKQFEAIKIKDIKKCIDCKFMKICGGGCRAESYYYTGDFFQPDPVSCEMMQFLYSEVVPILPPKIQKKYLEMLK